jgi:hypothetical protein
VAIYASGEAAGSLVIESSARPNIYKKEKLKSQEKLQKLKF